MLWQDSQIKGCHGNPIITVITDIKRHRYPSALPPVGDATTSGKFLGNGAKFGKTFRKHKRLFINVISDNNCRYNSGSRYVYTKCHTHFLNCCVSWLPHRMVRQYDTVDLMSIIITTLRTNTSLIRCTTLCAAVILPQKMCRRRWVRDTIRDNSTDAFDFSNFRCIRFNIIFLWEFVFWTTG